MKFIDFLSNLSNAMASHKTASQRLQQAIEEVTNANDEINAAIASFSNIDFSEFTGEGVDLTGIAGVIDLPGLANANPFTEVLNPVRGMARLFKFDLF